MSEVQVARFMVIDKFIITGELFALFHQQSIEIQNKGIWVLNEYWGHHLSQMKDGTGATFVKQRTIFKGHCPTCGSEYWTTQRRLLDRPVVVVGSMEQALGSQEDCIAFGDFAEAVGFEVAE